MLLGGTAQTIGSWVGQVPGLSREREVIAVELRGQGLANPALPINDVRLSVQVEDLRSLFREAEIGSSANRPVDLIGFSFGGRVALKYAGSVPEDVNAVSATSVSNKRGVGKVILQSWASLLGEGTTSGGNNNHDDADDDARRLSAFAWSSILNTHSPEFIEKNEKRIEGWVRMVAGANSRAGLHAILMQTHGGDVPHTAAAGSAAVSRAGSSSSDDPDEPLKLARACGAAGIRGQLITGGKDLICDAASAPRLAEAAGFELHCFADCAHAVPLESPLEWRREVLRFLDS